ncbi:hypothetical protein SAMN02745702_02541, partial [Desulfobaculum bizertense DSM 18034]
MRASPSPEGLDRWEGKIGGAAPKPPRKGMIPLRILIEFKSRSSFAWTAFKLVGA